LKTEHHHEDQQQPQHSADKPPDNNPPTDVGNTQRGDPLDLLIQQETGFREFAKQLDPAEVTAMKYPSLPANGKLI